MQFNIFGQTYDEKEPCFVRTANPGTFYNRLDNKIYTRAGLDRYAKMLHYQWGENERGFASEKFLKLNPGIPGIAQDDAPEPKTKRKKTTKQKPEAMPEKTEAQPETQTQTEDNSQE